ncbi:polysaccharide biosynthesis C-terminal domain-containing protein [Cysteiniphilum halobium]|uniref:polysaccharide biosynthesis C-terminal domain-containing protein n=1 Tax=Cysteiniphilum halobium TaxID=2219059 RepID=UPI000E65DBF7|nr:polysaccharide biosynthesis C-terminal domain-containing protein [Cysteiniphilum halobium]
MNRSIFSGAVASFVYIVSAGLGTIVQSAFIVRYLNTIDSGIWFLFLSIIGIVSFCDFGLSATLSREIGLAAYKKNMLFRISSLFKTIRVINGALILILCMVLLLLYYFFIATQSHSTLVAYAYIVFGVALIVKFLSNPLLASLYGVGFVSLNRHLLSFSVISSTVLSIIALRMGYGLLGVTLSYLVSYSLLYVLSVLLMNRLLFIKKSIKFSKIIVQRILMPSVQWTVMSLGAIFILQASNFFISEMMGVQYVTEFAVIKQLSVAILSVSSCVGVTLVPFISIAKGQSQNQRVDFLSELTVKFSTVIALTIAFFVYFFQVIIAQAWLGKHMGFNELVLILLLITTILEVHHVACAQVCLALGYVRFAGVAIVAGMLNLIFSYFFIKYYGVVGAAIAILLTQLLTNNWYVVWVFIKHTDMKLSQYFRLYFQLIVFSMLIGGGMWGLSDFLNTSFSLSKAIGAALLLLFVVMGSMAIVFSNESKYAFLKLKEGAMKFQRRKNNE